MGAREFIAKLISPPVIPLSNPAIICTANYGKSNSGKIVVEPDSPIGIRTTPDIQRVPKAELEACYLLEAVVFNGINKTTQIIMAPGYTLEGDTRSTKFFENFFKEIGTRGGELEWHELLETIFRHQTIFGEAWIELIPAKRNPDKIVDLQYLDPKQMDYAKDANGHIVIDQNGNPVGYVQTYPYAYTLEGGDKAPEKVSLQSNQIFFNPKRIAHFKLYNTGDGYYPIGLIEPAYKSIRRKIHLEEAHANSFKKNGFPRIDISIGDEEHIATEQQIKGAIESVKDLDNLGIFGHPNWVKIALLESKAFENLQDHLNYYNYQIVTATGLPMAFVTGAGDTTARSTLNRQEAITKMTLKDIINKDVAMIEKLIIIPVAESNSVNPVKIKWGPVSVEEMDGKSRRLSGYAKNGLLTPDDGIEKTIRQLEDLPPKPPGLKRGIVKEVPKNKFPKEGEEDGVSEGG